MMWNNFGHMGGFGFGFGWVSMLLFWGLIIWAVFALARGATGHGCWGGHLRDEHERKGSNALSILKQRYAKGELNKEEFEKMKQDLE